MSWVSKRAVFNIRASRVKVNHVIAAFTLDFEGMKGGASELQMLALARWVKDPLTCIRECQ